MFKGLCRLVQLRSLVCLDEVVTYRGEADPCQPPLVLGCCRRLLVLSSMHHPDWWD